MILDLRTTYAVAATAPLILGCVQIAAFATGRFERWPLWQGLSSIMLGLETMLIVFRCNGRQSAARRSSSCAATR